MILDANKVCFDEEQHIPNTLEKARKVKIVENVVHGKWCRCERCGVMHTDVESCGKVDALGCFQLSDMRYDDRNAVTERVYATVLQLYLI